MAYIRQKNSVPGDCPIVVLVEDFDGPVITGSMASLKKYPVMNGDYKDYFEVVNGDVPEGVTYLKHEV